MKDNCYCENRKAYHDYTIVEKIEAGIVLNGSEVKAVRRHEISLQGSYVAVLKGELWLIGCNINVPIHCDIEKFLFEGFDNNRNKKLLCHRKEIEELKFKTEAKNLTAVPLRVYDNDGHIKIEIGIARGNKKCDKRAILKEKQIKKELKHI